MDSDPKAVPSPLATLYNSTDKVAHDVGATPHKDGHPKSIESNETLVQEMVVTPHALQHVPILPPRNLGGNKTRMELDEDKISTAQTPVAEVDRFQLKDAKPIPVKNLIDRSIESIVTENPEGLRQETALAEKISQPKELNVPNSGSKSVDQEHEHSMPEKHSQPAGEVPQPQGTVVTDQLKKKLSDEEQPPKTLPINEIGFPQNIHSPTADPNSMPNHVDAVKELNPKSPQPQPIPKPSIVHNAKFRRAKLENIVAAIGTKNIERQQAKTDTDAEVADLDSLPAVENIPVEQTHHNTPNAAIENLLIHQEISEASKAESVALPAHVKEIPFHKSVPVDVISIKRQDSVDVVTDPTVNSQQEPKSIGSDLSTKAVETLVVTPSSQEVVEGTVSLPPILETEESQYPPTITPAFDDNTNANKPPTLFASATPVPETSSSLQTNLDLPDLHLVEAYLSKPLPMSTAVASLPVPRSPEKPVLEPQTSLTSMARPKVNRRGQDKPPKLSKATETDPRPECTNPPLLEVGETSHITQPQILSPKVEDTKVQEIVAPVSATQILKVSSSLIHSVPEPQSVSALRPQSVPNMIQISKVIPIPANTGTVSPQIPSSTQSSGSGTTSLSGSGQTVFALHSNASLPSNLCHQQGQPSITGVLPGGQKIPVKLVTIPRTSSSQFQTIPLAGLSSQRRGSPNILEAVNIVANANPGSRSNSPKTVAGNNALLQTTGMGGINLSTISLPGGGNIQLVPITLASTVGGSSSNPVKVLVSQPVKLNQSLPHHNMIMKSVMMGQTTASTTIRLMRPAAEGGGVQDIEVVAANPELLQTLQNSTATLSVPTTRTFAELNNSTMTKTPPSENILSQQTKLDERKTAKSTITSPTEKATPSPPVVVKISSSPSNKTTDLSSPVESSQKPTHKRVDDLEVLEPEFNQINDDDLPLEADIIHDLKDLEDVLAGENIEAQENGIDSPYDFTIEEKLPEKYQGGLRKQHQDKDSSLQLSSKGPGKKPAVEPPAATTSDVQSSPDSPIPVIRSSSPLYTYGNRSSSKTSRSPSPAESSDIHGEDQEIIDSFTRLSPRSPSQPKLSPQNNPRSDDLDEFEASGHHRHHNRRSPNKPDLISAFEDRDPLNQLSIEIPPVDLLTEHSTTEERKPARSTRSNTRLVSPDITGKKTKIHFFRNRPLTMRHIPALYSYNHSF